MEEKKGELRVVKRAQREGQRRTAAVRRKVRRLRRLVPGGRELQPEQLFLQTAEYIYRLRLQVHVLRAISDLYPPSP
ncbi:transcription factor bHLH146-like [Zingiber officinale]|uniref:transcription factor bHLH146-like n=1 Tax=Zingiber officinale TaxID=94328 RepID=UPI001C4C8F2C|nr:transcription factor bHLH146-like [Zingiber officinale]